MSSICFNPPIIAHRGGAGCAPENTLAAFANAKTCAVTWVEFDVQITADKQVVVFHDETLDRTSNGTGKLVDYSYTDLLTLDVGSWFSSEFNNERIPLFREVMQFLAKENMAANIELKPQRGQEEALIIEVIKELQQVALVQSRMLFSSFSIPALQCLRHYAPQYWLGLLMDKWLDNWYELCQTLQCVSIHVNHQLLDLYRVQSIKEREKMVLCYTVNSLQRAEELLAWGIDAIFSDYPELAQKILRK